MSRTVVLAGVAVWATAGYTLAVLLAKATEYAERVDQSRDSLARVARANLAPAAPVASTRCAASRRAGSGAGDDVHPSLHLSGGHRPRRRLETARLR